MGWLFVSIAAISEFVGVVGLNKYSEQKSFANALLFGGGFGAAFAFLYMSFNYLQVSTAYAVWIGIGTAGAVLINMLFFGESKSKGRIASLLLIIIGVIGLKALS
ncbi:DMT family transporter [Sporosarcina sp. SAFN-015]|uniref:DMT family transporter n=1 Tax=Sporosarcina sp. SAFN-015 TaxID=3387274 RepID=UPI003F7E948B